MESDSALQDVHAQHAQTLEMLAKCQVELVGVRTDAEDAIAARDRLIDTIAARERFIEELENYKTASIAQLNCDTIMSDDRLTRLYTA